MKNSNSFTASSFGHLLARLKPRPFKTLEFSASYDLSFSEDHQVDQCQNHQQNGPCENHIDGKLNLGILASVNARRSYDPGHPEAWSKQQVWQPFILDAGCLNRKKHQEHGYNTGA
ncbi:MAG: hypothetical protein ABSD44_16685 [Terracidiphilus sp.]